MTQNKITDEQAMVDLKCAFFGDHLHSNEELLERTKGILRPIGKLQRDGKLLPLTQYGDDGKELGRVVTNAATRTRSSFVVGYDSE